MLQGVATRRCRQIPNRRLFYPKPNRRRLWSGGWLIGYAQGLSRAAWLRGGGAAARCGLYEEFSRKTMPNEDAENEGLDRQDLPESSEPPKGESGDRSELAGHSDQSDELIVPTGDISQREAAALIRDAAGQLNDFLADRRRESEELARRMTRIEEEIQNNGNAGRHLTALSVIVAIIAFLATTGLWRLARHQSDVQSALRQTMTEVKASRDASMEAIGAGLGTVKEAFAGGIKGLEAELSGQREVAKRLEKQLGETSQRVAGVREHVSKQLEQQSELTKTERARIVNEIKTEISGLETALEKRSRELAKQSEELKSQQKEFSEAAAKAKGERQAMIRAATETVNAQLLSLQTMLDTLETEPDSSATATAAVGKNKDAQAGSQPNKPDAGKQPAASPGKPKQPQKLKSEKAGNQKPVAETPVGKPAEKKPAEKKPAEKKPGGKEPAANPATDEKPAGEKPKQVPSEKGSPKESSVADSGPAQKAAQAEAVSPKEAAKPTKADKPAPQSAEPEQDKPQPVQGSKDKA